MKFCPECGNKLALENAKFCPECGFRLPAAAPEAEPGPSPVSEPAPAAEESEFEKAMRPFEYERTEDGQCVLTFCKDDTVTEICIPEGVTEIGGYSFFLCKNLCSVHIPNTVTRIGPNVFSSPALTQIEIPDGVAEIGAYAFSDCGLSSITLPDSVKSIGDGAFKMNKNLIVARLPSEITAIPEGLFQGCSALKTVQIPEGVRSIGEYAFSGCAIEAGQIPEGVELIGKFTFERCTFETAILPEGVTEVPEFCFYGCKQLKSIFLPASAKKIAPNAFFLCDALEAIYYHGEQPVFERDEYGLTAWTMGIKVLSLDRKEAAAPKKKKKANTKLFQTETLEDGTEKLIKCRDDSVISVEIPEGVTVIGESAFIDCEDLEEVTLPEGLLRIEEVAFLYTDITSVFIPDSVCFIGSGAFGDMLASVEFEDSTGWRKVDPYGNEPDETIPEDELADEDRAAEIVNDSGGDDTFVLGYHLVKG